MGYLKIQISYEFPLLVGLGLGKVPISEITSNPTLFTLVFFCENVLCFGDVSF